MSTLTKNWTEEKFRFVISNLDKKTGLFGAELDIELAEDEDFIAAYCTSGERKYFRFNLSRFNDPNFKEFAAIDVIRHEYAHYYCHVAELKRWIYDNEMGLGGHGKPWEYACKMVEIEPNRYYDDEYYKDKDITEQQAKSLIYAQDIEKIHILKYIEQWKDLPMKEKEHKEKTQLLKERFPETEVFNLFDSVEHFLFGKGIVIDTRPEKDGQRVLVMFDLQHFEVLKAKRITKAA